MATVDANTAAAIKRRMGKKSVRFGHIGCGDCKPSLS